jgi:hypothetical protein
MCVFVFLFPQACAAWLRALLVQFDQRAQQQAAAETAAQTTVAAINEWADWIRRFLQAQQHGDRGGGQHLLHAQVLAASERFLQTINQHEFPELYHDTARICQHLRERVQASKKGPDRRGSLTPEARV